MTCGSPVVFSTNSPWKKHPDVFNRDLGANRKVRDALGVARKMRERRGLEVDRKACNIEKNKKVERVI